MKQLLNWFRRRNLENGLDRELQYHLERRTDDLMLAGLSAGEARRHATLEIGGPTQIREEVRDIWLSRWIRDFFYDIRFSARSFLRSPSFTVTAVLSLALGIGATTAIYSLVDQVVLHALPVRQPENLVLIDWKGEQAAVGFGSWNLMSYPICRDLQLQNQFLENVLCRAATTVNLSTGKESKPTAAEIVSGSYFSTLGINPAIGRLFTNDDDTSPGANPVVVLSYDFWKTQLAGDPDVIGRKVLINRNPMTVIGVADPAFRGIDVGEIPSLWIPATMSTQAVPGFTDMLNRRQRWMQILGRLKPGMTLAQAQVGLQPWFKAMLDEDTRRAGFPKITAERRQQFLASTLELTPAPQGHSGLRRRLEKPLWVLLAATAVLLALACLNVAGLFLARGSSRERELSTRLALGASRGRIGRQLLADSLLIAMTGGLLGILLVPIVMQTLIAFLPRNTAANNLQSAIDSRLLLFAFVVSVSAGVLSGFAPALQAARRSLISSLRERGGTAFSGVHLRKAIVTMQIAFTLILVIGAALFVRTLTELLAKGPGFNTASLISFGINPIRNGYTPAQANQLIRRIHDEIRIAPSTQSSAVARFQLLTGGSWNNPMTIQGDRRIATDRSINLNSVTPDFFPTLGIKMLAGRNFDERDSRPNSTRVAVVNEAFAKRYLEGRSPLGMHICQGAGPDAKPDVEIVGMISDFSYRGIREESEQAYFPIQESEGFYEGANFYIKIQGTPEAGFHSMRTILRNADPELPIAYFRTVNEQVDRSLNTERLLATLSTSFGTLALLLSLVGLYGVMSFVVTQRTREIGIRLALGATRSSALWLVLRDALVMIAAGIAIALPSIWALGRLVESQLYEVKPTDPLTIAAAILVLSLAALGAALIPARRASSVSPTEALRFDG